MAEELTIEQRKAIALANARLRLQQQSQQPAQPVAQTAPVESSPRMERAKELVQLPGKVLDAINQDYTALQNRGWQNLSPEERATAMAMAIPAQVKRFISSATEAAPGVAMRAVPPVVGQKIGEATRIPGGRQIGGALAGIGGEVAASRYDGQPITAGRLFSAGITGATSGKPMAGRPASAVIDEGTRLGLINTAAVAGEGIIDEATIDVGKLGKAFVGGQAAAVAEKALDRGKSAKRTAIREADNRVVDDTIQASTDAGYPIHDRAARPDKYERITNRLVRKDIGVPETAPLSQETLNKRIAELNEVYEEAASLSPHAAANLKGYTDARANAKKLWRQYDISQDSGKPRPELADAARAFDNTASQYEQALMAEASEAGRNDLFLKLMETRPKLAKVHLADRALNPSRGVINSKVYGDALKRGARLTGEAKIIADTFNANLMKERQIGTLLSRELTISKWLLNRTEESALGQSFLSARPNYLQSPDISADIARMAAMQAGGQGEGIDTDAVRRFISGLPTTGVSAPR